MKKMIATVFSLLVASSVFAETNIINSTAISTTIEGEYRCNDCHGYMTIKKNGTSTYKIWLGVSGGSCGGDVFANGAFSLEQKGKFVIPWKVHGKKCTTQIHINENKAYVSDSCISPDDESDTTCAILGEYIK
jgi:hypothetical protein